MSNIKKTDLKKVKLSQSLSVAFIKMTLLPIIFLVVIITAVSARTVIFALEGEVKENLRNTAIMLEIAYDELYPGEYHIDQKEDMVYFMKGDNILSGQNELIDTYKEETGQEITIFSQNIRVLTTLKDEDGNRIIGTGAHSRIVHDVIEGNHDAFYTNVEIYGNLYFVYYKPIYLDDGSIFGMIGITESKKSVQMSLIRILFPIILTSLITMVLAVLVSVRYSNKVLNALRKIELFLTQVAKGDLTIQLDEEVLARKDELGKIGTEVVRMEQSIKDLVEKDVLTGLYTRRYGNQELARVWKKGKEKNREFAIAIGDIDFFKNINDTYGHECGDQVLIKIAELMKKHLSGKAKIIRWGGEEFLFVFENINIKEANKILIKMLKEIEQYEIFYKKNTLQTSITVGLVEGDYDKTIDEIITEADQKLYIGKRNGRNKVVI